MWRWWVACPTSLAGFHEDSGSWCLEFYGKNRYLYMLNIVWPWCEYKDYWTRHADTLDESETKFNIVCISSLIFPWQNNTNQCSCYYSKMKYYNFEKKIHVLQNLSQCFINFVKVTEYNNIICIFLKQNIIILRIKFTFYKTSSHVSSIYKKLKVFGRIWIGEALKHQKWNIINWMFFSLSTKPHPMFHSFLHSWNIYSWNIYWLLVTESS